MHQEQIERRRQRALDEGFKIRGAAKDKVFSAYQVLSPSGRTYQVSIRSLKRRINGCTCPDYQTNLLGTCKHIEAVLAFLVKRLKGRVDRIEKMAPPTTEIFLSYGERIDVMVHRPEALGGKARELLRSYFDREGVLIGDPSTKLPVLLEDLANQPEGQRAKLQVSPEVRAHVQFMVDRQTHIRQREWFLDEVSAGRRTLDVVGTRLYPYQQEGALHLAFTGRALLADDMGLGKTIQAIAAAAILKELRGISKVLVVTPASLKHQWVREIGRFTSLSAESVDGPAAKRRLMYSHPAFFTVVNYELLLRDQQVFEKLAPDLIILDEAQRVKNWRTKTAQAVKRLRSRHAFVLTGTPIENNLDELYSILQTLDPRLLGPLWQFNSRYFQLEKTSRGLYKVLGYKNLEELRDRIRPVVLRRTRGEVLKDLPPRVDNNFFVPMTKEQLEPYKDYQSIVAQLLHIAVKRPLTPAEHKRLLAALQKMRILCDALELHDPKIPSKLKLTTSPKLPELEKILTEQVVDGGRKAIVFSSFEGMIDLAIERVAKPLSVGFVKLSGSIPTASRGRLLDRFREDPECRIFFSTDAGGLGLNLQSANLVINLDLPWNPAVLEQRIGRAHRMGQSSTVHVINLVAQGVLEERMLDTLAQKRQIFAAVFEALEGQDSLVFDKNRGLLARLRELLTEEPPKPQFPVADQVAPEVGAASVSSAPQLPVAHPAVADQIRILADRLSARLAGRLLLVQRLPDAAAMASGNDLKKVVVVVDREPAELKATIDEVTTQVAGPTPAFCLHLFDRGGYEGLLSLLGTALAAIPETLESYRSAALPRPAAAQTDGRRARIEAANKTLEAASSRLRLARLVTDGGFASEAIQPLAQALDRTLAALFEVAGCESEMAELAFTSSAASVEASVPARPTLLDVERRLVRTRIITAEQSARIPWIQGLLDAARNTQGSDVDVALVREMVDVLEALLETARARLTSVAL